jgi:hypothetical protein
MQTSLVDGIEKKIAFLLSGEPFIKFCTGTETGIERLSKVYILKEFNSAKEGGLPRIPQALRSCSKFHRFTSAWFCKNDDTVFF